MATTADKEPSYFRIHGKVGPTLQRNTVRDFVTTIKTLPMVFGRAPTHGNHHMIDDADGTISREHIKVDFNVERRGYELTCLSKNGAVVDKKKLLKDSSFMLKPNSAIRIGTAKFYIAFPREASRPDDKAEGNPKSAQKAQSKKRKAESSPAGAAAAAAKLSRGESASDVGDVMHSNAANHPSSSSGGGGAHTRVATPTGGGEDDNDDNEGKSTSATRVRSGYQALVSEALSSGELPVDRSGGVNQKDIVAFLLRMHGGELKDVKEQSLKKGVYSTLSKHFTRVEEAGEPLRWKL